MVNSNKQSITINFQDLHTSNEQNDQKWFGVLKTITTWLINYPAVIIPYFNEVLNQITLDINKNYNLIHSNVYVKIKNYNIKNELRDIKQKDLQNLIRFEGVVTRRS